MKINKIISMASEGVRIRFLAMERSLRAVGCDLPLLVIPYNDQRFDLPANAQWWEVSEVSKWLAENRTHSVMRKYQILAEENYQFVDADVCFLRNPVETLKDQRGFVTSCGHWRGVDETITEQSRTLMERRSTGWHRNVFNTGQFACDQRLFTIEHLKSRAMHPDFIETCIRLPHHEQPGINLLVFDSGVEVNNLMLPPVRMESTWAGDYAGEYRQYWTDASRMPYLIHWAGMDMSIERPINEIFHNYLSKSEREEWNEIVRKRALAIRKQQDSVRAFARRVKRGYYTFLRK